MISAPPVDRDGHVTVNVLIIQTPIKKKKTCILFYYRNDPKFSDTQFWANSADPDQTAPRGAV